MSATNGTAQDVRAVRAASRAAADLTPQDKQRVLHRIAALTEARLDDIVAANRAEAEATQARAGSDRPAGRALLRRPRLTRILQGIRELADTEDPAGSLRDITVQPNGLLVGRMRVPLGVLAVIYESRPEVTLEAAALAVKSGNAVLLRGSADCAGTDTLLAEVAREALRTEGLNPDIVRRPHSTDRSAVWDLVTGDEAIDLVVARGGETFLEELRNRSRYPVLSSGGGNCHIYVDAEADQDAASRIVANAKLSDPGMCNAVETLLIHAAHTAGYLPRLLGELTDAGVELRGCAVAAAAHPAVEPATDDDWATEYLAPVLAVRVVSGLEEAMAHIATYGTGHSEAIVTTRLDHARRFQYAVDAAAVYVNASTRFTYGYTFGIGPMLGISTQKLHARGPLGVRDLMAQKYVITGDGHTRETA
ncbi:glutamate-5-semialdehyde dehydrogenase [Streptomyces sp. NBC_01217]|uniref:glutamate-5-semialdehyde dehydrogenase n=1 Tax=Streptomyces sp. NBC_01217 TaxID=2903779 RepID=UPI002E15BDE1|nr:glutamate-5-semialdehyde dehydrogenase [Streptomyces sp. NBC_01217]